MEMDLIQVCELLQEVVWLLTARDVPGYLFTSLLHPFWQPPRGLDARAGLRDCKSSQSLQPVRRRAGAKPRVRLGEPEAR